MHHRHRNNFENILAIDISESMRAIDQGRPKIYNMVQNIGLLDIHPSNIFLFNSRIHRYDPSESVSEVYKRVQGITDTPKALRHGIQLIYQKVSQGCSEGSFHIVTDGLPLNPDGFKTTLFSFMESLPEEWNIGIYQIGHNAGFISYLNKLKNIWAPGKLCVYTYYDIEEPFSYGIVQAFSNTRQIKEVEIV